MATLTDADAAKAASVLKAACDEAYAKYLNSCSHAVWHVLTKVVDQDTQWLEANQLVDFVTASQDWKDVGLEEGWQLAKNGIVVMGGLKQPGAHGHVILIYPGEKKASGGYQYTYKDKKSGQTKTDTLRSHGIYPLALSTSQGSWPGARSKGDKTVWDPWGSDENFKNVKFWTRC